MATRKDLNIDPYYLDMTFNYKPITYDEIKNGDGIQINKDTDLYKMLCLARPGDGDLGVVRKRVKGKNTGFNDCIVWDGEIVPTIRASNPLLYGNGKCKISIKDVIHAQTFPEDYNFIRLTPANITYICGMSVPPVMIKRIVTRLIEQGVYDYKLKGKH